jgi:hypothetical protein
LVTVPASKKADSTQSHLPRVGDHILLDLGREIEGEIVEIRGNIGFQGKTLYRIAVDYGEGAVGYYEVPASEFRLKNQ